MLRSKKASILLTAAVSLMFVSCGTDHAEEYLLNSDVQSSDTERISIISTTENEETEASSKLEPKAEETQKLLPFQLDEEEELDLSGLSEQATVLENGEFYQDTMYFDYFLPQQYGKYFLTDTEAVEQYKELYTKALERSQYYTDVKKASAECTELTEKIDNMMTSYPTDSYVYLVTMGSVSYYREFMGMDIVIGGEMLEIIYRLRCLAPADKDVPIMEGKDFVWIAAVPKYYFSEESYAGWELS
ncbi:MAG: hypothetical protein K2I93_08055 [Oscillospiraceae bacterium]|nr:hypothetical protein [Oscillospiraceae bacterium]